MAIGRLLLPFGSFSMTPLLDDSALDHAAGYRPLPVHVDHPTGEVDLRPLEPGQFTAAHTADHDQHPRGIQPVAGGVDEELLALSPSTRPCGRGSLGLHGAAGGPRR